MQTALFGRRSALAAVLVVSFGLAAPAHAAVVLYDSAANAQSVCSPHYSKTHRGKLTRGERYRIYNRYGIARGQRRGYVIDHRAPVELGGLTIAGNLFPQPRADAKTKDREENALHHAVCSGSITLSAGQAKMLHDWAR